MRQADVEEAMRALQRARDAADRAEAARDQAVAARATLDDRLRRLPPATSRTAGQLRLRDQFRTQLRGRLAAAGERVSTTGRALRAALDAVALAQREVELALRAREAAEAQRSADDKSDARKRERRDQAAADDRWRPPRRS
jgi:hypothetical protein